MNKLLSVGLDVGTTTTQLIVSQLQVENRASSFSVPEMQIARREILYKSPVHFTPLLGRDRVDGAAIERIVAEEYANAGIKPRDVDTGAVIITGETSRKENARAVLEALQQYAGEFVVATAGPDLESQLAAKGAGADVYSQKTGKRVLHMDIGGGTSNLALIEDGKIVKTGCVNVGGRLIQFREDGMVTEISPAIERYLSFGVGQKPSAAQLQEVVSFLVQVLEMAAGLRAETDLLREFTTYASNAHGLGGAQVISFSGGVADCIRQEKPPFAYGDLGPLLGKAIGESRLCQQDYRLGSETIRATVIGAGCHAAQLSGSTVYYRDVQFPLKNIPVFPIDGLQGADIAEGIDAYDTTPVLAMAGNDCLHYGQISALADRLAQAGKGPLYIALQQDLAKALGHALALRTRRPVLCIDRVKLDAGSFLDVMAPVGSALPVVIKTLILQDAK